MTDRGPLNLDNCNGYDLIESLGEELDLVEDAPETIWRCWLHSRAYTILREPRENAPGGYIYTENGQEYVKVYDNVRIPFVIHMRIAGIDDSLPTAYPDGLGNRVEVDEGFSLPAAQHSANEEYRAKRRRPPPELNGEFDFEVISKYGRNFGEVERLGSLEELRKIANRQIDEYLKTTRWEGPIDELRGTLFYLFHPHDDPELMSNLLEAISMSFRDEDNSEQKDLNRFRSLYNAIRERWDEVEHN
ncbi:MAG: hypothetical protein WBD22_07140 [Pyrinomonadaceae bacterium]